MSTANAKALERWRSRALHEVVLPSGMRCQVKVPAAESLARDPRVPQALRMKALQFATSVIRTEALDEQGMSEMLDLQAHLAAMTLRGLWDEEAQVFVPTTLNPAELWDLELPSEDLDSLEAIALRRLTPAQVTASSERALSLIPPEQAQAVQEEEAGGTVDAYAPFRMVEGGSDPRADSPAVQHPPEPDAGDTRPSSGVGG